MMFGTKGRLKVTLLVVLFLTVGLGMYAVFHALDAYGDGVAIHNDTIGSRERFLGGNTSSSPGTCPAGSHARNWITATRVYHKCKVYTHRHLNRRLQWVVQYTRVYDCTFKTTTSTYQEVCNYRYPNGSQCGG